MLMPQQLRLVCLQNPIFTNVSSAALAIWAEVLGKNKLAAGLIILDVTSHACAFTAFNIIISYTLFNIESQLFNIDLLSHYRWWRVESIPFSWAFILFSCFLYFYHHVKFSKIFETTTAKNNETCSCQCISYLVFEEKYFLESIIITTFTRQTMCAQS